MLLSIRIFLRVLILLLFGHFGHTQCVIKLDPILENRYGSVYLASEMNDWVPKDSSMLFQNGLLAISIPSGRSFEGKLTLGSWDKAEVDSNGNPRANRIFNCLKGDTIHLEAIFGESRHDLDRIGITIPGYSSDSIYFPFDHSYRGIKLLRVINDSLSSFFRVLLFFDGQNLFSNGNNSFGSWSIDQCVGELQGLELNYLIVGIDHAGIHRLREYSTVDYPPLIIDSYGEEFGKYFVDRVLSWIVGEGVLIESLFVGGSSLGALMAWHMVSNFPELFDGAILFSPSFWLFEDRHFPEYAPILSDKKIVVLAGGMEGGSMKENVDKFVKSFPTNQQLMYIYDENGKHNEAFWSKHICSAISFCINNP